MSCSRLGCTVQAFCRMATLGKARTPNAPGCAAVILGGPCRVPAAVFLRPIKNLRPLATAEYAYWQPSNAPRGVPGVVPFRQCHWAVPPRKTPQVAQGAFHCRRCVHSRCRVRRTPLPSEDAKRRNVLEGTPAAVQELWATLGRQGLPTPCRVPAAE